MGGGNSQSVIVQWLKEEIGGVTRDRGIRPSQPRIEMKYASVAGKLSNDYSAADAVCPNLLGLIALNLILQRADLLLSLQVI